MLRRLLLIATLAALLSSGSALAQCPAEDAGGSLAATFDAIPAPSFRAATRLPAVPAGVQRDTLAEILSRINDHKLARAQDPSKPKGVVVLDIDYTAMLHGVRTETALERVGARYGIGELADASELALLPTYDADGFQRWVDLTGLRTKYPGVDWAKFQRDVLNAEWAPDLANTETITPGLQEFLRRVKYTGGTVVLMTGRKENERAALTAILEANGIEDVPLILKSSSAKTPAWKASKIAEIEATYGEVVAVVDDMKDNRDAMLAAIPAGRDVMDVPIAVPGFTTDITPEALDASPWRLSTFEKNRVDSGS